MNYKLIKNIIHGARKGTEFNYYNNDDIRGVTGPNKTTLTEENSIKGILDLILLIGIKNEEFFERIKEKKPKPKFRVGDYVVEPAKYNYRGRTEYIKIHSISKKNGEFIYNTIYIDRVNCNYLVEKELREPTQEELELYFR